MRQVFPEDAFVVFLPHGGDILKGQFQPGAETRFGVAVATVKAPATPAAAALLASAAALCDVLMVADA